MNDVSLNLSHFFSIFLEFAISSVRRIYWLAVNFSFYDIILQ